MGRSGPISLPGGKAGLTPRSGCRRLGAADPAVVLIWDELAPLGACQLASRHATGVLRPGVGRDLPALCSAGATQHEEVPAVGGELRAEHSALVARQASAGAAAVRDIP